MKNKTILVTGGTGSFGRKFVERILQLNPKKIIVFSRCELKQYEMAREVNDERVRFLLGDVRDRKRLDRAFAGVDYVIHAAALKQIPAAEYNPYECIKTNVLGAQNVIEAAIDAGVEKVVALSTDKAVSPINLYGAAKLCAEKLFTAGNSYSPKTRFSCVRYGNVIGSRGSVIPLFKKQAQAGKLTITDERMSRFWITLDQAVDLVLLALSNMNGGEIFIPKLPSMLMTDLAQAICPDCEIEIVGIRPGEKLHEAMIHSDDARRTVEHDNYFVIQPEAPDTGGKTYWGYKPPAGNVAEGFEYASDTNDWWLSDAELKGMI
jgi:UDP-N-acetylglucosamine 4,6-dehydratase/5-epimerase